MEISRNINVATRKHVQEILYNNVELLRVDSIFCPFCGEYHEFKNDRPFYSFTSEKNSLSVVCPNTGFKISIYDKLGTYCTKISCKKEISDEKETKYEFPNEKEKTAEVCYSIKGKCDDCKHCDGCDSLKVKIRFKEWE